MSLEEIHQVFDLNQSTFKSIVDGFKAEYASGLETASASGLATMIPSYVVSLPTGEERGTYLSLDLGGSTLRVCAVELLGNSRTKLTEVRRHIAPNDPLRSSGAVAFFDWIADTIVELIQKVGLSIYDPLSLGVCWSFPVDQTSISAGRILRMGKGFTIEGVEGYDLSSLFEAAFNRKELNVTVTALINDTVGTLVAHAYANPKTRVGFIYGTGVNAAYPEKISKMHKLKNQKHNDGRMLVNTEIDIFGSDVYLPLNKYDKILDNNHSQPEFQLYEKMMSGACMGELIRLAALDMIQHDALFEGHKPVEFDVPMEFSTAIPSDIEGHMNEDHEKRLDHFQNQFNFSNTDFTPTIKDLDIFTEICQIVSNRAARLAAAAMVSLIEQQQDDLPKEDDIVIGVNGSTYEKYPRMHERILESLHDWFGPELGNRIKLEVATDGGSIGGALIAMLAEKQQKQAEKEKRIESSNVDNEEEEEEGKKEEEQTLQQQEEQKEIQKVQTHQSQKKQAQQQQQRHVPNNQPPPPPFLSCLFGWLPAFSQRSKNQSTTNQENLDNEVIQARVEKR